MHKSNCAPRENTRMGVELEPVPDHPPVSLHTPPLSCPPSESRVGAYYRYPASRRGNDMLGLGHVRVASLWAEQVGRNVGVEDGEKMKV